MNAKAEIFDFSHEEVLLDLMMLKDCIDLFQRSVPQLIDSEKSRVRLEWAEDEGGVADYLQRQLDQGVTTRFLTGAFVISLWAAYESAVLKYADHVRKSRKLTLRVSDLKGNFLDKARKYFEQVLFFDLHPPTADWDRLRTIAKVRNALAHANGRLEDVSDASRAELQKLALTRPDFIAIVDDEYFVATCAFAADTWELINSLLTDLHGRVKAAH